MTKMFDVVGYAINGSVFCACCCEADEGGDPIFAGEEFDESIFCEDCGEPVVEVDDGLHEVAVLKVSYTYGTMKVKAESFREAEQKVRELIRLGNLPPDSPEVKWEAVGEERMELDPTL